MEIKRNLMRSEECAVIFDADVNWIRPILIALLIEHISLRYGIVDVRLAGNKNDGQLTYRSIELKASGNNNRAASQRIISRITLNFKLFHAQ